MWLGKPKGLVAAQLRGDRPEASAAQKGLVSVAAGFCQGQQVSIV
jgi:hypothetical protein